MIEIGHVYNVYHPPVRDSSWLYGSWIYNYLCNQCLSSLTLRARIPLRRGVFDTTLCDKVCQWQRQVEGFLQVF